jgi:hypothetical protein
MEPENAPPANPVQQTAGIISLILGLTLLGFGLWALGGAIYVAWGLFQEPESITRFASYFLETTRISANMPDGAEGAAHMAAWLFVVTLLLVLGKLGDWAISVGARLLNPRRGTSD